MKNIILSDIILNDCENILKHCSDSDFYSILSKSCNDKGFGISSCDLGIDVTDIIKLIYNNDKKSINTNIVLTTSIIHENLNILQRIIDNKKCIGLCRNEGNYDFLITQSKYFKVFMCLKCGDSEPCIVCKSKKYNFDINLK